MPGSKADLALEVATMVGGDLLTITDAQTGWPALGTLRTVKGGDAVPVALFVATVGLSQRDRDDVERRFQNPGQNKPIEIPVDRQGLLVGVWQADRYLTVQRPLLVSADPIRRSGRMTRYSVFVKTAALLHAEVTGWSEDLSTTGEAIRCFIPELLPVAFEARDETLDSDGVRLAVAGAGLDRPTDEEFTEDAAERVRRATLTLVRDARFSRSVMAAYDRLCAMCGLDLNLVEAAHIYPASAPGSMDKTWNGLSLCANHHLAFDRHLIWVEPEEREIKFHPIVLEQVSTRQAAEALVGTTKPVLVEPNDKAERPRSEMFERRYEHFGEGYAWAG